MSSELLRRYIRLIVEDGNARVPTQLISPGDVEKEKGSEEEEQEGLEEFSGCGGSIAGYTAPLGASGDDMGRKKNRSRHDK